MTTCNVYSTPAVKPVTSRSVEVGSPCCRVKVGFESGLILIMAKVSMLELPGVEIPLPLTMMEFVVEARVETTGTSGSKINKSVAKIIL